MSRHRLEALTERREDGTTVVAAPKVGRLSLRVTRGQLVDDRAPIGTLDVLGTRWTVFPPAGLVGRVVRVAIAGRGTPVEYGEPLFELSAAEIGDAPAAAPDAPDDLPVGGELFRAPMDGQFYRRPGPDDPLFANDGDIVAPGATLGLIEVMKFFYPMELEADGPRRVFRFLVEDSTPVQSGQPIAILQRPA